MRFSTSSASSAPVLIAHSTGGMMAARYALMYPGASRRLFSSIRSGSRTGRRSACRRLRSINGSSARRRPPPSASRPTSRRPITPAPGRPNTTAGDDARRSCAGPRPRHCRPQPRADRRHDLTQPVVYEFPLIKVPTLLMIGLKDVTAIGKDVAPPECAPASATTPSWRRRPRRDSGGRADRVPRRRPRAPDPGAQRFNAALIEALGRLGRRLASAVGARVAGGRRLAPPGRRDAAPPAARPPSPSRIAIGDRVVAAAGESMRQK